jgi:hypothetical protein
MARDKFSTLVKPTITGLHLDDGAFGNSDVVFDWAKIELPKGASRVLGANLMVAGNTGVAQSVSINLLFSNKDNISVGVPHAAPTGSPDSNHILGALVVANNDVVSTIPTYNVTNQDGTTTGLAGQLVLTPHEDQIDVGHTYCYVSGFATIGTMNFATGVTLEAPTSTSSKTLSVNANAHKMFFPGDEVTAAGKDSVLGVVDFVSPNGRTIKLKENAVEVIAGSTQIFNANPVKIRLHCER